MVRVNPVGPSINKKGNLVGANKVNPSAATYYSGVEGARVNPEDAGLIPQQRSSGANSLAVSSAMGTGRRQTMEPNSAISNITAQLIDELIDATGDRALDSKADEGRPILETDRQFENSRATYSSSAQAKLSCAPANTTASLRARSSLENNPSLTNQNSLENPKTIELQLPTNPPLDIHSSGDSDITSPSFSTITVRDDQPDIE